MTTKEAIRSMQAMLEEGAHLITAYTSLYWDESTGDGAPPKGAAERNATKGYLAEKVFKMMISPEMKACIDQMDANRGELSELETAMLRAQKRQYDKAHAIPPDEYRAYTELTAESEIAWRKAKLDSDFATMLPYFEKIFAYQHKIAGYYGYKNHPYDALLDDYEEGLTIETLDTFFSALRTEIVPLLAKVTASKDKPDDSFLKKCFPEDRQILLGRSVAHLMGIDFERTKFGVTEHPFMTTLCPNDARITTHYYENDLFSALYSTLHEGGHAMYELGMAQELVPYGLRQAASTAFHESQSRSYENMFGRSRQFMDHLLPRLKALFPDEFAAVDADMLYRAANIAQPSLIRIEADELTYCLHIMIRYEIEKGIMENKVKPADLPAVWNEKVKEYLGITPPDDRRGVLQDTHWPGGMVGYFPSYALGNAYGAQIVHAMRKTVDVDGALARGDFSPINKWLGENIHSVGCRYTPSELIVRATGEPLNPTYYTDYLKAKFKEIYRL